MVDACHLAIKALEQEPTIQERQAESDRWQKAFDDGLKIGKVIGKSDAMSEVEDGNDD